MLKHFFRSLKTNLKFLERITHIFLRKARPFRKIIFFPLVWNDQVYKIKRVALKIHSEIYCSQNGLAYIEWECTIYS
jgi:hypothetical protein